MRERNSRENSIQPERDKLFRHAKEQLQFRAQVYRLGEKFEGLSPDLAEITMLDVTTIPGCHYGAKNVFVPIIESLENQRNATRNAKLIVSPDTTILVEASTGNGWVAFSDAAEMLGYEHVVVMPDGLPKARYQHPDGREVTIVKTPKGEYVEGMPKQLKALMDENKQRVMNGEKIYVSPNHAVGRSSVITVENMATLGQQLLAHIGQSDEQISVVLSMGNGASLCSIGEYVKKNRKTKVVATESFAYGGGYERFAQKRNNTSYEVLFGIKPGHPVLMEKFSAFGTNAPIGIELPLQTRAFNDDLIDDYILFTDNSVLQAYEKKLRPSGRQFASALDLPNYSGLPKVLWDTYGNSTLANISVASIYTQRKGQRVVAMAYDGRQNYLSKS